MGIPRKELEEIKSIIRQTNDKGLMTAKIKEVWPTITWRQIGELTGVNGSSAQYRYQTYINQNKNR